MIRLVVSLFFLACVCSASSSPIRVACLGDSITQGSGAAPGMAYPSQLQELLGDGYEVRNFGVGGRTMLRKGDNPYWNERAFRDAQAFAPDVVVLMLGTNDTKPQNWAHAAEFEQDYRDMVAVFRDLPSRPKILVCRPCPVVDTAYGGINPNQMAEVIGIVDKVARSEKVGVVDVHGALVDKPSLLPDRIHPNTDGARIIAETVFQAITGEAFPLRAASVFGDHAVLQRGREVPVWGTAPEGEVIQVEFGGHKVSTTSRDGKWMVKLPSMAANTRPQELVIRGKERTLKFSDVLVGEVWLASGQSNMERQLGPRPPQPEITDWKEEAASAEYPLIRELYVAQTKGDAPSDRVSAKWTVCSPESVVNFSAVGYFFARDLFRALKVPVGVIHSSWGGTMAEVWISRKSIEADPGLRTILDDFDKRVATYESQLAEYKKTETALLEKYEMDLAAAKSEGKPEPRKPGPPGDPRRGYWPPGTLFNGMIAPLVPYAMQGVIWYQGESNNGNAAIYRKLFPAMIADWRKAWGQGDFPFLFVQVAPFARTGPNIREAQFLTVKSTPNTAMVVTTDCGEEHDIHPRWKQPVGQRLSLAARALAYGEKLEFSGPLFESMKITRSKAVLTFSHANGLVAKDGELTGFQIAGTDKKFVPAEARIERDAVVVSSPQIAQPADVRFGWANVPAVNLYNSAGLPASPFRTDSE